MKKIICVLFLFFLLSIHTTSANWYGNHTVTFTNPGLIALTPTSGGGPNRGTSCDGDGDPTGGAHPTLGQFAVADNNNAGTLIPETDAEFSIGAAGNMRCLYWDAQNPTGTIAYTQTPSNIAYTPGTWSNEDIRVVITCNDLGGSDCNMQAIGGWTVNVAARTYTRVFTSSTGAGNITLEDNAGNTFIRPYGSINIDKINPTGTIAYTQIPSNTAYTPGTWSNEDIRVVITCNDLGGSDCNMQAIGGWTVNVAARTYTRVFTSSTGAGNITLEDNAGNTFIRPYGAINIDKISPLASDISPSIPANGTNLLADNLQAISLTVGVNGGSPIIETTGYFEDRTTVNSYRVAAFTENSGNFSQNVDIRNVDLDRETTGERQYSFKITRICDQAGNCTNIGNSSGPAPGIRNFSYNVYANTLSVTSSVPVNPFSTVIVADGGAENITLRLRDTYGNIIIPATSIGRTVSLSLNINNNLRLDQYTNTSSSAFFAETSTAGGVINIGNNIIKNLGVQSSTTGDYTIPFFVFAPTSFGSPLVPGNATINDIRFAIAGSLGPNTDSITGSSNIDIRAQALFTTLFSGEVKTQGFIEGVSQNSSLAINKINASITSSPTLYFEFGNYNTITSLNETNPRFNLSLENTPIREGSGASTPINTSIGTLPLIVGSRTFESTMLLQSGAVNATTNSYLATIVRYVNTGKTIVYPSDILGKTAYHGLAGDNNSFQAGVKIIGNTSSQNTQEITTNQFSGDVRILGNIEKSLARKDIQSNVYELIRNMTPRTAGLTVLSTTVLSPQKWDDTGLRGQVFYGSGAIYFGSGVTLNATSNIEGNKTLIVEGNVYINGNIQDSDNDGMLGIIALAKNGVGGNIYINPSVTDIHAILYADRSVLSYNGSKEFDGSNSTATELANQLYIKGSVFSENTIGGSRKTPIACPYFVNIFCTQSLAQKYDMNYLRRYFIYDSNGNGTIQPTIDIPANAGSRSTGGAVGTGYEEYPVIIDYNTRIQQTPPPFFGK